MNNQNIYPVRKRFFLFRWFKKQVNTSSTIDNNLIDKTGPKSSGFSTGVYSKIFYSTGKYLILKNIFMFATGIFSIFVVRLLSPAEYGKWALVYQLVATLGPILSLGFLLTLSKFIPEHTDVQKKNELFSKTLFIVLIVFSIFSIAYFIGTFLFPKIIPKEIKIVKYPFLFFIGALAFVNLIEGYYRGLGKFNQWTVIDGSRSILSAGLAILLILTLSNKFETVFYTYFFTIILFLILLFGYLRKNLNLPPNLPAEALAKAGADSDPPAKAKRRAGVLLRSNLTLNLKLEPRIIKFSLIMLAGQIIYLLMSNVNPVLLRTLLKDPAEVGYYFVGIRLCQMVEIAILGPLSTPFLFYFSHPDTAHVKEKTITEGTKFLGILFGFISLIFFSFADKIIPFFFGKMYNESIPVMKIYSFWVFLLSLQVFAGVFFISINKPLIPVTLGFILFLLNFSLNILFIPHLKTQGAALASTASIFFIVLICFYFYEKNGARILSKITPVLFVMLFSLLCGIFIHMHLSPVIFIILSIVFKQISNEDIEKFKKVIKGIS